VKPDRDRDRLLEDALKHELGATVVAPATAACLDAETLAAWIDGGLDAQSAAMAEAHASSCARCQALIGTMARIPPAVIAGTEGRARLWRWWFAPLAAGVAATTLWMVVPPQRQSAPSTAPVAEVAQTPPAAAAKAPSPPTAPPPATLSGRARDASKDADEAPKLADNTANINRADAPAFDEVKRKAEALMKADKPAESRDRAEPRAVAEQAAAAPPVAQLRMQQRSIGEIQSADASHRWRAGARGAVEYSEDGGRTWQPVSPPIGAEITAGSSPSPTVGWLVGRGGVVLLTVDGRTFTRLPFPEAADLVNVIAVSDRTATVTTADGRAFVTDDAGRSWRRQ
jgi:hypothetical protein